MKNSKKCVNIQTSSKKWNQLFYMCFQEFQYLTDFAHSIENHVNVKHGTFKTKAPWKYIWKELWEVHAKTKEKKKNVESILIHCRMNLDKYKWSKYSIFVIIPREHAIVYSTRSVTAWKRLFPIANKLIVMQYYNNLAAGLVNKLNIKDCRSN